MVVHTFNLSTWEAEAGGSLWIQGQPGLQSEFQDSQGCTEKPYLKRQKATKQQNQNYNKTIPFFWPKTLTLKK